MKIRPKTARHQDYWDSLVDYDIKYLACTGPAGTGKTTLAAKAVVEMVSRNKYNKVYIVTPMVEVDDYSIGWLPGDLKSKTEPHLIRITQHLDKFLDKEIEVESLALAYIRGLDLYNCCVILDEAQNCTCQELKAIFTRMAGNSKLIILGDFEQNDMKFTGKTDFQKVCEAMDGYKPFDWIQLDDRDIVRSKHIGEILKRFDKI